MSRRIQHGDTNQRVRFRALDSDGVPTEGLAYNEAGIAISFQRLGSTATSITLAAGTGLGDDHSDGKMNEIGDGWYQLDAPDGAFSSGVESVLFYGSATGYTFIFESVMLVTSLTASDIVDEWETQSQADPTGFHVNVREVNGTSVSGPNDFKATGFSTHSAADVRTEMDSNSTQLAAIVEDTGTTIPATLTSMTSAITTIDGIVDAILLDTAEIGAAGAGLTEAGGTGDQLTAITGIILDAAGVRSAVGLASANLDTQLLTIVTDTNDLQTNQGNWLTATGFSTHSASDVNTAVEAGAVGTTVSTINTNVSTLLSRIPAALFSGITSLAQWLGLITGKQTGNSTARTELRATGAGSGTYDETTDSLEAIRDRGDAGWVTGGGGGSSGARTVAVTVDDGTNPVQSATVRMTKGAESYTISTNASGQGTFNLDDGTWTVAISRAGYSFAGTTLVVDDDKTPTYSMSAVTITPSADPAQTNGYFTLLDSDLAAVNGGTVYFRMAAPPRGESGTSFDGTWFTKTSDSEGLVEVTLAKGALYYIGSSRQNFNHYKVPTDAESTHELPSMIRE